MLNLQEYHYINPTVGEAVKGITIHAGDLVFNCRSETFLKNCFTFNYMLHLWPKKREKSVVSRKQPAHHECLINLQRIIVNF